MAAAASYHDALVVGRIAAYARVAFVCSKREALMCQIGKVSYIVEHVEVENGVLIKT